MAFGVFIHRQDSIYDDSPAERYQFPKNYLRRVEKCVDDWIIYYEPVKVRQSRGYFAVAKVQDLVHDPNSVGMYFAIIDPATYLDFPHPVAFNGPSGVIERGLLNERNRLSGRAQAAVRLLSPSDFARIIDLAFTPDLRVLPRTGELPEFIVAEERDDFQFGEDSDRVRRLTSRLVRDQAFRRSVLHAYGERCAITGLKLINGGGRAEVEAAHIKPVSAGGPDKISNGLALSGTVHWMFDRGLIGLQDDLSIMISRQANDPDQIRAMINGSGRSFLPDRPGDRPLPAYLKWHRENCFKS